MGRRQMARWIVSLLVGMVAIASVVQAQTFISAVPSFTAVDSTDLPDHPAVKGDRLAADTGTWKLVETVNGAVIGEGVALREAPSRGASELRAIAPGSRVAVDAGHAVGDTIWWHLSWLDDASLAHNGWMEADLIDLDLPPPS